MPSLLTGSLVKPNTNKTRKKSDAKHQFFRNDFQLGSIYDLGWHILIERPSAVQVPIDCPKRLWGEKTYQGRNNPPKLLAESNRTPAHWCNIPSGVTFCKPISESKLRCCHCWEVCKRPRLKRPGRNDTGPKRPRFS